MTKNQTNIEIASFSGPSESFLFWSLKIVILNLFGIWILRFGA